MKPSRSLLPQPGSHEAQVTSEVVNELSGAHGDQMRRAVRWGDLVAAGLVRVDGTGGSAQLRAGNLLEEFQGNILGIEGRVRGLTEGQSYLRSTIEERDALLRLQTEEVTDLRTRLEVLGNEKDGLRSRLEAESTANRQLLSRVTAGERYLEVLSRDATQLGASVALTDAELSWATGTVLATAKANQELTARVEVNEDKILAQSQFITDLQASVAVLPTVYLQPDEPAGGTYLVGDMWLESDNGNKVHVWDGEKWGESVDLVGATIYAQPEPPTGGQLHVGDLWFDTDDNYRQHRWNGQQWVDVTDPRIDATATAVSDLSAEVELTKESINALSQDYTALDTAVNDPQTGLATKASNTRVSTAESRLDNAGGPGKTIESVASDVLTLRSDVNNAATKAELTQVQQTLAAEDEALSQRTAAMESRMPTGTGDLATAGSVTQVTNRVSTVEGTVEAHTQQISDHTAAIAGKADSSTVTSLSNTVTQQGTTLTAQGQQLSGLSATVGGNSASINELREVSVSGNAIEQPADPSFEGDSLAAWNGGSSLPFQVSIANYEARSGSRALRIGWGRGFTVTLPNSRTIRVRAGEKLRVGFWARTSGSVPSNGAQVYIGLWYTTATGGYVDYAVGPSVTSNGAQAFGYEEFARTVTVPPGAENLQLRIVAPNWGSGFFHIDDVYVARPGAILSEMLAKYTLAVQAGGVVAGMQLLAGGGISAIRMLAEIFEIVDPSGAAGYTHRAGISVWRVGGLMIVIGPGFGQGGQFGLWIGPNLPDVSQCTKANATMFFTVAGEAYFGGSITVGTLENKNSNTAVSNTATVQIGPFATHGKRKEVSYSLSYSMNTSSQTSVPGNGSEAFGSATLVLERQIGSGAWTQVATRTVTGTHSWESLEIDPGIYTRTDSYRVGGSDTFTDTDTSTSNFSYRVRITSASGWPHGFGSRSQTLSVRSLEE